MEKLYFAATPVEEGDLTYYELGTGEDAIRLDRGDTKVRVLAEDVAGSGKDFIRYGPAGVQAVEMAHALPEFVGLGYVDALVRLGSGISNFTWNQLKLLFRAIWQTEVDGEIVVTSGSIKAFEDDTNAVSTVKFTKGVEILGVETE